MPFTITQNSEHETLDIRGDRAGLETLRTLMDVALRENVAEALPSDGGKGKITVILEKHWRPR